jgi:hypothetical protein
MPRVIIKSGEKTADGREEALTEYFCDWPGCPNIAEHSLGVIRELRVVACVCHEHMEHLRATSRRRTPGT